MLKQLTYSVFTSYFGWLFYCSVGRNVFESYLSLSLFEDEPTKMWDSEMLFDLEGSYLATESLRITVGVRNLFDTYPQYDEIEASNGRLYRSDSIVDWQGGYYYTKLEYTF